MIGTPLSVAKASTSPDPSSRANPSSISSLSSSAGSNSSASPNTAEDIRDIRGPKTVFPAWLVPALIAAAIVLAVGFYAFWRWRRRRRAVRPLLPFELALQKLEQIRPLMQPSQVREFSIAITDIVRHYIEQRFQVIAAHRTTEEFLRELLATSQGSLAAHRNLLAQFLEQCDLAKFAGMSLSKENMEALYRSARTFVLETAKPEIAIEETRAAISAT